MKQYALGFDGGGTKTRFVLTDEAGNIVLEGESGPSNFYHTTIFYQSLDVIVKQIISYYKEHHIQSAQLSICGGFAGVAEVKNAENDVANYFRTSLKIANVILDNVLIISDAALVLHSYFPDTPGIILISGTGSICLSKDKRGDVFRSGGYGYMIDDIASGFYFGRCALHLALKSHYHQDEQSVIEHIVKKHFGISDIKEVIKIAHSESGKKSIASTAPLLFEAAKKGCNFSKAEIAKGIEGLSGLIKNCLNQIGEETAAVALHGSVVTHQPMIREHLEKLRPECTFFIAEKRAELAAIQLVK